MAASKTQENRFRFTQERLAGLTCPPSGRDARDGKAWFYDTDTKGLALCVTEGGAKAFYYYRRVPGMKAPKRAKLADVPDANVGKAIQDARKAAEKMNGQREAGETPVSPREKLERENVAKANAPTVGGLWASYRDHWLSGKRDRSRKEFERLYTAHLEAWADRPLDAITSADVEKLKTDVAENGKYVANRLLELISAMYRRRGHAFGLPRGFSPTVGVDSFPEAPRDRVLTVEELGKVMAAIDADDNEIARDYFKMLIYTGMRRGNVAAMAWNDLNINAGTWKIPGEKAKNGKPLVVTLIPEALAIIKRRYDDNPPDSPYVFPSRNFTPGQVETAKALRAEGKTTREIADALDLSQTAVMHILSPLFKFRGVTPFGGASKAWARILRRTGISQKTTLHDIRRTFCTQLCERGVPTKVVQTIMGHRTLATTMAHYAMASDKAVAEATRNSMAGLLADVAKAGEEAKVKEKGAA